MDPISGGLTLPAPGEMQVALKPAGPPEINAPEHRLSCGLLERWQVTRGFNGWLVAANKRNTTLLELFWVHVIMDL